MLEDIYLIKNVGKFKSRVDEDSSFQSINLNIRVSPQFWSTKPFHHQRYGKRAPDYQFLIKKIDRGKPRGDCGWRGGFSHRWWWWWWSAGTTFWAAMRSKRRSQRQKVQTPTPAHTGASCTSSPRHHRSAVVVGISLLSFFFLMVGVEQEDRPKEVGPVLRRGGAGRRSGGLAREKKMMRWHAVASPKVHRWPDERDKRHGRGPFQIFLLFNLCKVMIGNRQSIICRKASWRYQKFLITDPENAKALKRFIDSSMDHWKEKIWSLDEKNKLKKLK